MKTIKNTLIAATCYAAAALIGIASIGGFLMLCQALGL